MVRLACPDKELRIAGGREMHLRSLQSVGLQVANSIFLGDYLTSEGQDAEADLQMIADAGFTVLGAEERARRATADDGAPAGGCCAGTDDAGSCGSGAAVASEAGAAEDARPDTGAEGAVKPELRRRGAGTAEPANA